MPPSTLGKYRVEKRLGGGTFGTVYLVESAEGQKYAAKVYSQDAYGLEDAVKEEKLYDIFSSAIEGSKSPAKNYGGLALAKVSKKGCHPNIVCMVDKFIDPVYGRVVVTELMTGDLAPQDGAMPDTSKQFSKMILDTLTGLQYMHNAGYYHADIKPANMLYLTHDGQTDYKLGDLGNSCYGMRCPPSGTADQMAPEMAKWFKDRNVKIDSREAQASDIWSMGISYINILTGGDIPYISKIGPDDFRSDMTSDEWIDTLTKGVTVISDPVEYHPRTISDYANKFYTSPSGKDDSDYINDLLKIIFDHMIVVDHRKRATATQLITKFRWIIGRKYPDLLSPIMRLASR